MSGRAPDDPVAALWREVRPNQVAVAEQLVVDARAVVADRDDLARWGAVRRAAHRLAGTLGSFGQVSAGEAAVSLEQLVGGVEAPDRDVATRAATLAEAVLAALTGEDP